MQTRHRIPTVFSIYMVDVLCCALGCVILLWQLYHHESQEQTAAARDALKKLDDAGLTINSLTSDVESLKVKLDSSKKKSVVLALELEDTRKERDTHKVDLDASKKRVLVLALELDDTRKDRDKAAQLALVRKQEYDDMKKILAAAEATIAAQRLDIKSLDEKNTLLNQKTTLTAKELAEKIRAHADLLDRLAESEKKLRALTKDLALKESDAMLALKRVDEKTNLLKLLEQDLILLRSQSKENLAKLGTADIRVRLLEGELERGKRELIDFTRRMQELSATQDLMTKRYTISVKDLETAKLALANLEADKISLLKRASVAENRFAGITLTGQKVVFLVDMSGSMEMVDENTLDPDKWPIVCETIARVMSSLTGLTDYQVIVFSDRARFAFGNDGRWLKFQHDKSPKEVADGLKAIKPKGGTDMYAAFNEAFRLREEGLDTIYVFSDGLPNMGEGLPANAANMTENQRTEILSKHVRGRLKNVWNRPLPGQSRVRINTIGFFFESPDVGAFLWALAREHDGSFVGMSRP